MTLLAPSRLLLFVPVLALAVGYVALQRRRRTYAARFTSLDLLDSVAPRRPGWRRHVTVGLAGLAASFVTFGLAQPAMAMDVVTEDAIVVLAIDTSTSMQATDVEPDRLTAAITEAVEFVEDLPDGAQVGLVSFSGTVRVLSAPTTDHEAVIGAIEQLQTGRGTAGGDAIDAALATIEVALSDDDLETVSDVASGGDTSSETSSTDTGVQDPAATIILLSDGATTRGLDLATAAGLAAEANVPVSTITYGTSAGQVTVDGRSAQVPPDAATMQEVADATGGTAFEAASADELSSVYDDLEARIGTEVETRELTLGFVAAGLGALMLAAGAAFVWSGRFL